MQIIDIVATDPTPRTAREIAAALGMPVATAYHLLDTLVAEGMLAKDTRRVYHLGPRIGMLAAAFQRRAPPPYLLGPLHRLAQVTRETAYLSALQGNDVVLLHAVEGSHAVLVRSLAPGYRGHAHARASGKVFLAHRPDLLERVLERGALPPLTPNTITDSVALRRELDGDRRAWLRDRQRGVRGRASPAWPRRCWKGARRSPATRSRRRRRDSVERRDEIIAAVLAAAGNRL